MLLIHGRESAWDSLSEAERAGHQERYGKLQREMEEHGRYVGGDGRGLLGHPRPRP